MKKQRSYLIDNLRGLSVIGMILIHANAYYLSNKIAYHWWNWSQFVVPLFIFCSSYLYFFKTRETSILAWQDFFPFLKKRVLRLLIPFHMYLIGYFSLHYLTGNNVSWEEILRNATLTTRSNDTSWLVLLFVYLTLLLPLLDYVALRKAFIFLGITILSYVSAVYFLFVPSPLNFKLIMWLPWLTIVIATWFLVRIEQNKRYLLIFITLAALMFLSVLWYKMSLRQSLSFYNNKYPPNMYYLSYGLLSMGILTAAFNRNVFPSFIGQFVFFMSKYSYSIFFIHFLILFAIVELNYLRYFQWYSLFLWVTVVTVAVQLALNYFFSILKKAN